MIRVKKSETVPESLITTKRYDGEDTKRHLIEDQHEKCYICERRLETDFTIDHLHGQNDYQDEKQAWSNLFLACSYCNGKKLNEFPDMLNPSQVNIEDEIQQSIDFAHKKAVFNSLNKSTAHDETIKLLERVFNGTNKIRKIKENRFFNRVMHEVIDFLSDVNEYRKRPSPETEKIVRDELSIKENFLGFKYWVIKTDPHLLEVFAKDIVWNKR